MEATEKRKAGRPRKDELTIPKEARKAGPCPTCIGEKEIEGETCGFCNGSGIDPVSLNPQVMPEDVTDEDVRGIERSIGLTTRAWGHADPRVIIAAAVNWGVLPKIG